MGSGPAWTLACAVLILPAVLVAWAALAACRDACVQRMVRRRRVAASGEAAAPAMRLPIDTPPWMYMAHSRAQCRRRGV